MTLRSHPFPIFLLLSGACMAPSPASTPQGQAVSAEEPVLDGASEAPTQTAPPSPTAAALASAPLPADAPLPPMVELDPPEVDAAVLLASSDSHYQEVVDLVRAKQWKKARKALEALVTTEETKRRYDRFVAGKALSARLAELDGDDKAARSAYTSVLAAWSDPDKAAARITDEASGEGEHETNRRLAGALIGVGAATYAGAEHAREAAAKIVFPAFGGPRTKDAVLAFVNKKVAPWLSSKRDAIEKAEQSYGSPSGLVEARRGAEG